jgi:hypothetical protein
LATIHSHYDNLRVARNAPLSVIKAAYRALSQDHHPDRRLGDADATRIMSLVNEAYAVLSDTDRRRAHEEWLALQEAAPEGQHDEPTRRSAPPRTRPDDRPQAEMRRPAKFDFTDKRTRSVVMILIFGVLLVGGVNVWTSSWKSSGPKSASAAVDYRSTTSPPAAPAPVPEQAAQEPRLGFDDRSPGWVATDGPLQPPNGKAWPRSAGYLARAPRAPDGGLSSITIDNRMGGFHALVKLCPVRLGPCKGLRSAFVPAGQSFTMTNLKPGQYEIRYQDVATRASAASPSISLREERTDQGTRFSKTELTLYRVADGNMSFTPIPADQF